MITPSNPAGALAATAGDWKVARIFSPTASACFTTSRPTFPLAPVIRIIAVSLNDSKAGRGMKQLQKACSGEFPNSKSVLFGLLHVGQTLCAKLVTQGFKQLARIGCPQGPGEPSFLRA